MKKLLWVTEPADPNAKDVESPTRKIRLSETDTVFEEYRPLLEVARKHAVRGMTMQSLAIKIYLEQLGERGFEGSSERTLKRDIKEARRWHEANGGSEENPEYLTPVFWDGEPRKKRKPARKSLRKHLRLLV